jgi:hypothetical protein
LKKLFEDSVDAGFINPENVALVTFVDLPGGEAANADESRAEQWGEAAINALRDWSQPVCLSVAKQLMNPRPMRGTGCSGRRMTRRRANDPPFKA